MVRGRRWQAGLGGLCARPEQASEGGASHNFDLADGAEGADEFEGADGAERAAGAAGTYQEMV